MNLKYIKTFTIILTQVFTDQKLTDMLCDADDKQLAAFKDGSKYQILVQQGKTPESIRWVFFALQLDSIIKYFW